MNARTALIGAGLVVVAIVALIVLNGSEDGADEVTDGGNAIEKGVTPKEANDKSQKPRATNPPLPTIVIGEDGKPVGSVAELTYEKGDSIRFKVESAVADHVHVHGYDLIKDLEPGGIASFNFPASIEGIFEAELEDRGEPILELRVEP